MKWTSLKDKNNIKNKKLSQLKYILENYIILSFNKFNNLFDGSDYANDVIHKLISIHCLYLKFSLTLTTLFVVAFLTS